MSDFALMVTLELGLLCSTVGLLWAVLRSAEVRREDEWMSGEWLRGKR